MHTLLKAAVLRSAVFRSTVLKPKNYKSLRLITIVVALLTALSGCATAKYDCNKKPASLVIVGESAGPGSVAAQGQVFKRLSASLAANLSGKGYRVNDNRALFEAYPEYFKRDGLVHNDKNLADLVRSSAIADVVIVMSVEAMIEDQQYHRNIDTTLLLRMVDVKNGKTLTSFVLNSDKNKAVRPACKQDCLQQGVVDNAKPLTLQATNEIASALSCGGGNRGARQPAKGGAGGLVSAYTMIFDGFSSTEVAGLEASLQGLAGYESHRVVYAGSRHTEYWYETSMASATLNRQIQTGLSEQGLRGLVQFSGNTYTVKKITLRGKKPTRQPIIRSGDDW